VALKEAALALVGLAIASNTTSTSTSKALRTRTDKPTASNISRQDYVGPGVCGECHADEHARWSASLHRVMNARADEPAAIVGDFSGVTLRYAGGDARFWRDGGTPMMTLAKDGRTVTYRVTRTIGRRGLQEYVGVIVGGDGDEVRLPFGWWPRRAGWYPQPYFDPWLGDEASFDAYAPVREPWAERCPWCHSTYPFASRIARASGPRHLGHGLEQYFASSPAGDRLAVAQQVTTGISCESCHLGGRDHVDGATIHFVPHGAERRPDAALPPETATFAEERADANVIGGVCAQCHSGPSPRLPDGTALRNSAESLDLARSPCTGITCLDCHDPHRADSRADDDRALRACTRCHDKLAAPAAARRHAGHDAATCLDCHMPRVVMGIDRFVRSHRISSPTNTSMIAAAAPNACNLCHLDRTIGWTLDALRDRHGVALAPRTDAYADEAVGEVWLASRHPAIRLIAAAAYARSPLGKGELAQIKRGLDDPLAYVRVWTLFAVEDIVGHRIEYDPRR